MWGELRNSLCRWQGLAHRWAVEYKPAISKVTNIEAQRKWHTQLKRFISRLARENRSKKGPNIRCLGGPGWAVAFPPNDVQTEVASAIGLDQGWGRTWISGGGGDAAYLHVPPRPRNMCDSVMSSWMGLWRLKAEWLGLERGGTCSSRLEGRHLLGQLYHRADGGHWQATYVNERCGCAFLLREDTFKNTSSCVVLLRVRSVSRFPSPWLHSESWLNTFCIFFNLLLNFESKWKLFESCAASSFIDDVLFSAVHQSDSVTHVHTSMLFRSLRPAAYHGAGSRVPGGLEGSLLSNHSTYNSVSLFISLIFYLFNWFYFLWKHSWCTMLCQFLLSSKAIQLHRYVYLPFS